ncbi:NAD(P)-dependent oxidoreductase [Halpernia frigidisoli]|uniref:NAD(P)H-binding n=1 Tax=Halpernia frigidisoli TaxID=1125876 RepID=A0A1I3F0Z1_9FLAO|nr:NAD(P)H-binding protein [Halpernia frigidisoli]SFI04894.1 NAD(P)H-binding [Halpernia frigidisoli]
MKSKIIVFGGTGDVGQIIVRKLLDKEQNVCILTRQEKENKDNLTYKVGNVLELETFEQIIQKDDKIIVALGFNNSSLDTMSKGTANIISAMKKNGATRLVCLSAQGAGDSWEYMPNEFKEMVLENDILKASFKDHGIQEEFVKNSDLKWTIVRPTEITGNIETANFTVNNPSPHSSYQISNLDVAQFIVTEILEDKYLKQIAMITN